MLNIISGYCKGRGQWEGASGIQPRQMVGKQISWQISAGNSPFFRRQIVLLCLISCTAALPRAERQSGKMDSDLGIIVANLISDYSFSTVSPCWGFESKPRQRTWPEAEIQHPPLEMFKQWISTSTITVQRGRRSRRASSVPDTLPLWPFSHSRPPCPLVFVSQLGKVRLRDGNEFSQSDTRYRQISLHLFVHLVCPSVCQGHRVHDKLKKSHPCRKLGILCSRWRKQCVFGLQVMESRRYPMGRTKFYITAQRQGCRWVWGKGRNEELEKCELHVSFSLPFSWVALSPAVQWPKKAISKLFHSDWDTEIEQLSLSTSSPDS